MSLSHFVCLRRVETRQAVLRYCSRVWALLSTHKPKLCGLKTHVSEGRESGHLTHKAASLLGYE